MKINSRRRSAQGNMILLMTLVGAVLTPIAYLMLNSALLASAHQRQVSAIEAGALAAANDLSRVVIEDPHFGPISLSDYAPAGGAIVDQCGEPIPVVAINTLLGTNRLDCVIADQIGDGHIQRLADMDYEEVQHAATRLNNALLATTARNGISKDRDGRAINLASDVEKALRQNLPAGSQVKNVSIELGWLRSGGNTVTPLPQPEAIAQVPSQARCNDCYASFVNAPYGNKNFYFAGVDKQSKLVNAADFQTYDRQRPCSIVKIEADIKYAGVQTQSTSNLWLHTTACAQPFSQTDTLPAPVLGLSFSRGIPIASLNELFSVRSGGELNSHVDTACGDYPQEGSTLVTGTLIDGTAKPTVEQAFADSLYSWLRECHCNVDVNSLTDALAQRFDRLTTQPMGLFTLEAAADGQISLHQRPMNPFNPAVTADSQTFAVARKSTGSISNWVMTCRNQVGKKGNLSGRHGGQPMPGSPINWQQLPEFGATSDAFTLLKEHANAGLLPIGRRSVSVVGETINGGIDNDCSFQNPDGSRLNIQPRRSYYGGALAVYIEINSGSSQMMRGGG